ncbi:Rho GTPase activation protein [Dichotomocladium elegans]|nr:Rho GTPase activation protein [Dichotomocladium elegans]
MVAATVSECNNRVAMGDRAANTRTISSSKSLFGAPLSHAVQERSPLVTPHGLIVPDPVAKCFAEIMKRGLTIEGLFRLSGAASDVRQLANEFDQYNKDIDLSTHDIHTITGVAKKYLRALPDPVIPRPFHSSFLQIAASPSACQIQTNQKSKSGPLNCLPLPRPRAVPRHPITKAGETSSRPLRAPGVSYGG